ncbi:MAG: hypothetical protein ACTSV7_11635 [Candidatus Baldrarchaeia archaeon]
MSWEKESIIVLVKAAPNWSRKYKEYQICTAGISQDGGWRRLYPFPEDIILRKNIRVWDIIEIEVEKVTDDPRPESRKIKADTVRIIDRIEERKERRNFLTKISDSSLNVPIKEKRTLAVIKPQIEDFKIKKEVPEHVQLTLNGKIFKRNPYGDVGLYYKWSCSKPCQYCKGKYHVMRCFDWGANVLYRKYNDAKEAEIKTKQMCFYKMKYDYDTWFALGTHSRRPFTKWMIIGLLWMKKALKT